MTKENKKAYHITLTDNKTGEIKLDYDTDGLLLVGLKDEGVKETAALNTSGKNILLLLKSVLRIVDQVDDFLSREEKNDKGKGETDK